MQLTEKEFMDGYLEHIDGLYAEMEELYSEWGKEPSGEAYAEYYRLRERFEKACKAFFERRKSVWKEHEKVFKSLNDFYVDMGL